MSRPASRLATLLSVACAAVLGTLLGAAAARADVRTDCYVKRGEAAIRACTEAIARNPRDVESYISRAYERYEKGEHALSLADYAKAIEIDPKRWDAFQGRAWAYLKLGKAGGCFSQDSITDAELF